jgi:hypothetical protein
MDCRRSNDDYEDGFRGRRGDGNNEFLLGEECKK